MKYGLPYKGSKNKLAERIVRLLPKRTHLVDLFCGGCAVSHAAMVMKKYEHIHINDLNWMCPTLFIDALSGKYNNETRWISREDFFRLRDTDPYVAVVWSFGNNLRSYLYSQEIEPLKKAIHYAMFFSDYSLGRELGHDLSFIDPIKDIQQRYLAVKRYFSQYGHFQQQSFEGGADASRALCSDGTAQPSTGGGRPSECSQPKPWNDSTPTFRTGGGYTPHPSDWKRQKDCSISLGISSPGTNNGGVWSQAALRTATPGMSATGAAVSKKKNLQATLGSRTPRASQQRCTDCSTGSDSTVCPSCPNWGRQPLPITSSVLDYAKVEIPQDSVIYCDIPYEGTNVYNGAEHFDYERFYDWAEHQTEPVFISSYQMPPDRFDCIQEYTHRSTLSAKANNRVTEKIFVPKGQIERGNIPPSEIDIFGQ